MSLENQLSIREAHIVTQSSGAYQSDRSYFDSIIGFDDVKRLFGLSLESEKPVHILLVGPPASAKTLFMLECMKFNRSYFTLGSHSTKAGMIDYLFKNRPKYLIIDEIEHMPNKDQTALLSLMETCLLYTSPSPRDRQKSRMPSSA